MAELFPLSVVLHFPPEVYLSRGVGDLCPLLVRAWHGKEITALQFLRGGRVRVTVRDPAFRAELLSNDLFIEDRLIPVTPAGVHAASVHVRDLPVELSDESVKSAFSAYGEVFSVRPVFFKDFPQLRNGNRVLLMSTREPIPSSLVVLGFPCRTWYPGQPVKCPVCRQPGHSPRACPLSGLCRRCKQPGHVARECTQGPPRSTVPVSAPSTTSSAPVVAPPVLVWPSPAPSPVPAQPVPDPVPSPAPASSPGTSSEEEGALSSDSSVDPSSAPSFRFVSSPVPAPVPASPSAADFKKLVSLVLSKVKLGSGPSQIRALTTALAKSHKLSLSQVDVDRIVSAVTSARS